MPKLPGKKLLNNLDPQFLQKRQLKARGVQSTQTR